MSWDGDERAIHDDIAGEVNALTEKTIPVDADLVIIEDSAGGNVKKKAKLGNLPGGSGGGSSTGVMPSWQDFTPVWTTTGTAPSLGNGTLEGKWLHYGKMVIVKFHFAAGSTTTFGTGTWRFSLPIQPVLPSTSYDFAGGEAYLENNGVQGYHAQARFQDVSSVWQVELIDGGTDNLVTNTGPFTWGNDDFWNATLVYEVATDGGGSVLASSWSPILDHKPTTDTVDDNFDASTLDGKWTAVSGAVGTVDPFAVLATNSPIYDLITRPDWLMTQVRQNDGSTTGAIRLRQDFTLADGDSIVIAHTLPTYTASAASANESGINLALNDTDSDHAAGNRVICRWITNTTYRTQLYGGTTTTFRRDFYSVHGMAYTRFARKDNGATKEYYFATSLDGSTWEWYGPFGPGVELTNLWIGHDSAGGGVGTDPSPIVGFYFVRQGDNQLDPWSHSRIITVEPVIKWTAYTPDWTSTGTAPSIGNGTLDGKYAQIGEGTDSIVLIKVALTWGSTTSGGTGDWRFSLPITAAGSLTFAASITEESVDNKVGVTKAIGTNTFEVIPEGGNVCSVSSPFTWGTNDTLFVGGSYEAA
jgi:hypothetical protein